MTTPHDVAPAPEASVFSSTLSADRMLDKDAPAASLSQEINERRARVENTELLQHLRGL